MVKKLHEQGVKELLLSMNKEDKTVPMIVEKAIPQIEPVIQLVISTIKNDGKVYYLGSGTSGRLGILDASECPPTFGVSPTLFNGIIAGGEKAVLTAIKDAEDDVEAGHSVVKETITSQDVLITLSASGSTPYVIGAIEQARELSIKTAGIVCNDNTKIASLVDYPIELLVGEEIIQGSSRLKAGTAQKLVLNMISTISMTKLGKVYNNYMVNVQATNEKLRKRIVTIIKKIANVDEQTATDALQACRGDLKAAVLVSKYNLEATVAEKVLIDHDDNLGEAIKCLKQ